MKTVFMMLYMIAIGAAIGAFTNYLAIKMLFRPHNPIYIGKWRVPFTPGLIPRRREELAVQLGIMVVNHLLSAKRIRAKILNKEFQEEITRMVQKDLDRLLSSDNTVRDLLRETGLPYEKKELDQQFINFFKKEITLFLDANRERPIRDLFSNPFIRKLESKLPRLSAYILKEAKEFVASQTGKEIISLIIDDYAGQKPGMVGRMLQKFLANVNLTDKIQKEILKFLSNESIRDVLTSLLKTEWEKILDCKWGEIEKQVGREQIVALFEKQFLNIVKIDSLLDMKISDFFISGKDEVIARAAPRAVEIFIFRLSEKIAAILEQLRLEDLVREQVESFSVQRLEEMVLLIMRREFKMITYLGGLLGGFIGFIQGLLVIFY